MRARFASSWISIVAVASMTASAALASDVISVYPTGSVKQVQQVTARFSADMVPMGDPRSHKDPFTVTCTGKDPQTKIELPKSSSRWIDSKNWSYDFAKPLAAGVKCVIKRVVERDLKGDKVAGFTESNFSTGGPNILSLTPRYGEIEPEQYFLLRVDSAIDTKSVEALAYFETSGLYGKVGVRVVTGPDREKVIRAAVGSDWQLSNLRPLLDPKQGGGKPFAAIKEFESFIVLAGKNRFQEKSKIVLHWPKGILSQSQVPVDEPQQFDFDVIPPFEAKFSCERVSPERPCNPILDMRIEFSRMVDRKRLEKVKLVGPKGEWIPLEFNKAAMAKNQYRDDSDLIQTLTFQAPFPEQTKFKIALPTLKDELGRPLANQAKFPLEVATDEFTPLVKFAATFGLLERNADPVLPVSVRNVEKQLSGHRLSIPGKTFSLGANASPGEVIKLYERVSNKDSYTDREVPLLSEGQGTKFQMPKPGGEREFELVGIPLKEPGLHVVELASPKLGQALLAGGTMYVASAALVTNLSVHLKKGRESSAVWVTTLDQAKPVANADVSIVSKSGAILASGKSDASGLFRAKDVKYPCAWDSENRYGEECEVYAFAKSGDDFSFVSNRWSRGIEDYRFNLSSEYLNQEWGPITAHAVLDRSLIQAGETLHIKTYLREYTGQGFKAYNEKRIPKRVLIVHRGSNKTYSFPFVFDAKSGTAVGEFKVPKDATLGFYEILLSGRSAEEAKHNSASHEGADDETGDQSGGEAYDYSARSIGNFMVAEYRLPVMASTVKIQNAGGPLISPKEVKVDLSANYLSGGPARDLKVKLRSSLNAGSFAPDFPGASEYQFFSRPVKAGTRDPGEENGLVPSDLEFVFNQETKLGETGGALAVVKGIPMVQTVRNLVVEMEYRDPNGEVKTGRAETTLFPSDAIVGLRSDSWMAKAGKASVAGIVVNPKGKPVAGQAYVVEAYRTEHLTHRKRLVGGFYSYDSSSKTISLGKVCDGKTGSKGEFTCAADKLPSGSVTLQARTTDAQGRSTVASVGLSIYEEGDFSWWTPSDSDRIDLLPEKTSYQPGETAKFVLRSPFPVSTVLVTVEREGVLDAFVRTVSRDKPVIEVPLAGNFAPNVFVSALAIRGRVGDPKPTALIDLARPAMKLGISEIKVGWKSHELKVVVTPERKRYRTRERAVATVKVTRADGSPLASAESEIAIAVVDEAIALLRKNWSLDLLSAMMGQRPLAVDTSSAQNQVIGKRHFGSKAKPPGGGGGVAGPENRELFDPLLLWIPRVKLDANGEAKITIPLNDSMTSFRINAVAHSGLNHFGSGSSLIESSKDLILYSGFAPVVRDGDQIQNALTVRNTTEKPMKVELSVTSAQVPALAKQPGFDLKPSEAKIVSIPVTVPPGLQTLEYIVTVKDTLGGFSDSLKVKTKVHEAVPPQVLQATLFQLEIPNSIPVQQPKDALPGRGGLSVETRSTLLAGLAGVKAYMEQYPYSCLEQRISKGIALEDAVRIKETISEMPSYFDGRGLLKFFPTSICGSQQLSRYVLTILKANGYELPPETSERVLAGLQAWLNGATCSNWWDAFVRNPYRDQERLLVMDVLSLYGQFKPEWFKTITVTPNLWKTTTVVALHHLLKREMNLPNREALMKQAENILRARINYQGTLMNLQGEVDWEASWYLFSSRDQEALAVLGLAIDEPSWQEDVGRIVRGTTSRLRKGAWDTTTANAWGVTELRRFSAKFEKDKVVGSTVVAAPGLGWVAGAPDKFTFDWAKNPKGEKTLLKWPTGSQTKPVTVAFTHQGSGKPWVMLQTKSAIPLSKPWDLGYTVTRKVTRVSEAGQPSTAPVIWKSGDVANIELTVTAKYDHPWVVIRDPIPAGASHLGTGLDGESSIMDRAPKARPSANQVSSWPTEFEEKSQSHFISYAAYLMKGTYKTNYRVRLNSSGTMNLPPTHVEALYSPETFGEAPIAAWKIAP